MCLGDREVEDGAFWLNPISPDLTHLGCRACVGYNCHGRLLLSGSLTHTSKPLLRNEGAWLPHARLLDYLRAPGGGLLCTCLGHDGLQTEPNIQGLAKILLHLWTITARDMHMTQKGWQLVIPDSVSAGHDQKYTSTVTLRRVLCQQDNTTHIPSRREHGLPEIPVPIMSNAHSPHSVS